MEEHFQFNLMKCTLHTQIYQIRYGINIVKCVCMCTGYAVQYAIEASIWTLSPFSPLPLSDTHFAVKSISLKLYMVNGKRMGIECRKPLDVQQYIVHARKMNNICVK